MLNKLTISAAALAAFGMAGAASAQEVVNIDVLVEEIAQLVASDTTGAMTVDGTADRFMGNTASGTGVEPFATGDYATVRLNTNHSVDSLEVTFPQTNGIRDLGTDPSGATTFNGTGFEYFGKAVGTNSNTLGVFPGGVLLDEGTQTLCPDQTTSTRDAGLPNEPQVIEPDPTGSGPCNPATADFENGTHLVALGVATNWGRTLIGEPIFAEPDTYSIQLTATIMP